MTFQWTPLSLFRVKLIQTLRINIYLSLFFKSLSLKGLQTKKGHCLISVRIWIFSCQYFPTFGILTEYRDILCSVSFRIQSECGKIRTRKTPNTDTFHAVGYINQRLKWNYSHDYKISSASAVHCKVFTRNKI